MKPTEQATQCYDQMAIVEKYERVIAYLYPIAQSMFLSCLLGIPDLLFQAGKSNQVSKIYAADAGLAHVRFWLRFLVSIRSLTAHQLQTSQVLIAEVGKMIGAWIKTRQSKG